jgi:hypothetical protein
MGHFSVVFVKIKIFYGLFNLCMEHLHRITKLYVSNGPWLLPFPITVKRPVTRKYMTAHFPWYRNFNQKTCNTQIHDRSLPLVQALESKDL